ncbi:DNA-processing protein DprA [Microbacterium sp. A8/3-1]|uniref:DNA-processing protein DprA n=1 Tax=Microbacterium sp. A8/3-1 TaxID=3160749 RepID=A0AAU7VW71_9MICO
MPMLSHLAKDERTARMVLALIGPPNDTVTGGLLMRVGAVELITLLERDTSIPGLDRVEAAVWRDRLRSAAHPDHVASRVVAGDEYRVLIPEDFEWPTALNDLGERTPYALWTRGRTELLTGSLPLRITVTGARAATGYGVHVTDELSGDLVESDRILVAGGAYGIEGSVHRAALTHGDNTIAVLASGLDRAYPVGHADLIESIAHRGLVLTEAPPASAPTRQRFRDRARILAALSGATIVVEAGFRSGTLQTAREASLLGRFVGAVPGPVTSAASAGTNHLLQDGRARVVTCGPDVVRMLGENTSTPERNVIRQGAPHVVLPNTRVF